MKSTALLALAASAIIPSSLSHAIEKREEPTARVVKLDLHRTRVENPIERDRLRRRQTVQATLDNLQTLYFLNGSVGTPPQPIRMHVDTGSSDLWVNAPFSQLCRQRGNPCRVSGSYSANASSTYGYVGSYFNISYVDGSGASGDYVTDTFTLGGTAVENFQFGVGYQSTSPQGILGIGYPVNEVQVGRAKLAPYENLPLKMVTSGLIQSNAFSLYLNDLDANTGNILFGGIDTEQFEGDLQTLPIQSESGVYAEFLLTLTKLELGNTVVGDDIALAVLLDSGSSLTYLPNDIVNQIYSIVGAVFQEDQGVAFIPCRMREAGTPMKFTFSSPTITVSMDELVLDIIEITGKRLAFNDGEPVCLFGIAPAGQGTNVLGDTFMRSAYIVYDLDNNEISLAQTSFNATGSNILEIGKGATAVPSATQVKNPVAATAGISRGGQENAAPASNLLATYSIAGVGAFFLGIAMVAV